MMEATPKVHRHRHRRSDSRHHQPQNTQRHERHQVATTTHNNANANNSAAEQSAEHGGGIIAAEEGCSTASVVAASSTATSLSQENERQNSSDGMETTTTTTTQQTVVLVNGHAPPPEQEQSFELTASESTSVELTQVVSVGPKATEDGETAAAAPAPVPHLESPTQPTAGSSRNSSGDALSLRETLQQLPATVGTHRHRRTHSPQSPARRAQEVVDSSFHRGILGFMDRELKHSSPTPSALSVGSGSGTTRKLQSLSDPTASPAQRSVRSRSSLEKSPRRKRSKSESRRRRERKLIAAGEMEVRQANETLMRYLKQCSEMNDASLSGELEIDQSYDERRVHRKTKSQRDKRGHLISKLYTAGGLSSILKELSDDIVPAEGEEIYNPFTPVVSPTEEDTPAHIDKMFLQTSSGYRPVEHCYYKHSFVGAHYAGSSGGGRRAGSHGAAGGGGSGSGVGANGTMGGMRTSGSYGDTRCLLDADCSRHEITSNIQVACVIQRIWILISNICHGLLAGLALAHLLFVLSSHPMDWSRILNQISLAGETLPKAEPAVIMAADGSSGGVGGVGDGGDAGDVSAGPTLATSQATLSFVADYATFAEIYLNTFYCLTILCLVSVLDRMDICRWDLSNATELISFRWLIIAMIYIATIILTICSDSIDERLYYSNNVNVTLTQEQMLSNSVMSVWSSLSVTRSIGAICGWIMIGLTPHEDLLYEHLLDLTKYQMTNN